MVPPKKYIFNQDNYHWNKIIISTNLLCQANK